MGTKRKATSGEMTTKEALAAAKEAYWAAVEAHNAAHEALDETFAAENEASHLLLAAYAAEYPDET
jgi:hypothetical protein